METFNEQQFEKKLLGLKDTQENISTLSMWCLQNPQHHKKIVTIWLQVLKKVKIEQRLTLFYLANDVIQYSKRKGYDFVESWGPALQKATTMVRDDKVKNKILRLFKIWDERSIYDEAFLVDLSGLLISRTSNNNQEAQDFQPATLISKIRSCKSLEDETDFCLKVVNEFHLSLSDVDVLMNSLKERKHSADIEHEVDEGLSKMTKYILALKNELDERRQLIELLDLSEAFYENQRGEAKIVCNAYRNFGNRVKALKRKLDDLILTLPSPIPSPDINAPSPSPESDIDLPEENLSGKSYGQGMGTFIGKLVVPDKGKITDPKSKVYNIDSSSDDLSNSRSNTPLRPYQPPTPPRSYKRKSSKSATIHPPKPEVYEPEFSNSNDNSVTNQSYLSSAPISSYDQKQYSAVDESYVDTNIPIPPYVPPSTTPSKSVPQFLPVPPVSTPSLTTVYPSNTSTEYSTSTYSSKTFVPKTTSYNTSVYPTTTSPTYAATNSAYSDKTTTPSYLSNSAYPETPPYQSVNSNYSQKSPYSSHQANNFNLGSQTFFSQNNTYPGKSEYEDSPTFSVSDFSVPPPKPGYISPTPLPFSYSSSNTMPPLLGEDFPINGMDINLPTDITSFNDEASPESSFITSTGFSSFMGNPDLQFQIQKDLFSDTPASPSPEECGNMKSPTDIFHSDSNTNEPIEGKPIEVISKSTPTNISDILKALGMNPGQSLSSDSTEESVPQLNSMDDVYLSESVEEKTWNQPPLLPPKFPTWSQSTWTDTPASPPNFEKYGDSLGYDPLEADSLILAEEDTDLRTLSLAHGPHGDIDHRNLISLTGSPRSDIPWSQTQDKDYRKLALSTKPVVPEDNVESVDMEMSSEEEAESSAPEATKASTSVSFSLTAAKILTKSPLIEKEEPKATSLPRLDAETPPPQGTTLEPPPLPDMNIFPVIGNSEHESKDSTEEEEPTVKENMLPVPTIKTLTQPNAPHPRFMNPFRPRLQMNRPRFPHWRGNMRGQQMVPPPPPPPLPPPLQNMRGPFPGPRFRPSFDNQAFRGRLQFRGQRWPQRFNS